MRRIGHNFRDVIEADPEIVRLTKRGLCGRTQHNAAAIVFSEFSNGSQRRLQQFSVSMVSKESIRKLSASSGMIDSPGILLQMRFVSVFAMQIGLKLK